MSVIETAPEDAAVFPAIPGNAGHRIDEAPLPYWLDRPCPAWCLMTVPHEDHEMVDDRCHMSASFQFESPLEEPDVSRNADGSVVACHPARVGAGMWQHYREGDPYIALLHNDDKSFHLTVTEAASLAETLMKTADRASEIEPVISGGSRPFWQVEPCPAWCTTTHEDADACEDRIHVGDYWWLTMTMENPIIRAQSDSGTDCQPAQTGVRLEQGWREIEARVTLVCRDDYMALTLGGASELAGALTSLLRQARDDGQDG
jgi:hypothetical protein